LSTIRFGTDGWRAIIGEDFTFTNVRILTQALVKYLSKEQLISNVVVGYDTRFLSFEFAKTVAVIIAQNNIPVTMTSSFVPTPALSYCITELGADAGVMVTSSHNPFNWNGIKIKTSEGISFPDSETAIIESYIDDSQIFDANERELFEKNISKGLIKWYDPQPSYIKNLENFVHIESIKHSNLRILIDPMHGSAQGWMLKILEKSSTVPTEIHGDINPSFPSLHAPEPITQNLTESFKLMHNNEYDVCLSTDGDGDRFGIIDDKGNFINQLEAFALLVYYYFEIKELRGPLIRSVTMSRMIDKLGEKYNSPVFETPVGFKHLSQKMLETNALLAGEESGGAAFIGHIPERDGILAGLIILDLITSTGEKISDLRSELYKIVGPHSYHRLDIPFDNTRRDEILDRLENMQPNDIAGFKILKKDNPDGYRFTLTDDWWLLIRISGTEPLIRIYAEMPNINLVKRALDEGQKLLFNNNFQD